MSYNLLPLENDSELGNLPSFNRFPNSLLLIETAKNIRPSSFRYFDAHEEKDLSHQDSLGLQIMKKESDSIKNKYPAQLKKKKGGCTCKKTKCLKMYCQCFAMGQLCTQECECISCHNDLEHQEHAQKAKLMIESKSSRKANEGCICHKSQCQKKYCKCFAAGKPCTKACKCIECLNIFNEYDNNPEQDAQKTFKQMNEKKMSSINKQQRICKVYEIAQTPQKVEKTNQIHQKQEMTGYKKHKIGHEEEIKSQSEMHSFRSLRIFENENLFK